jgi:hypothetical protein
MSKKIGRFLVLLGLLLTAMFILSDLAQAVEYRFLIFGAVTLLMGILILAMNPGPQVEPPQRFRLLKKIMDRESKDKKKDQETKR